MRLILPIFLMLLSGCQNSFDKEYAETEKQLKKDAKRLDKEMAKEAAKEPGAAE